MKTYLVSADHIAAEYRLDKVPFVIDGRKAGQGRIGHREANETYGYPEEFWADMQPFGCGKSRRTPEAAIRELLHNNGCTNVRVVIQAWNPVP